MLTKCITSWTTGSINVEVWGRLPLKQPPNGINLSQHYDEGRLQQGKEDNIIWYNNVEVTDEYNRKFTFQAYDLDYVALVHYDTNEAGDKVCK